VQVVEVQYVTGHCPPGSLGQSGGDRHHRVGARCYGYRDGVQQRAIGQIEILGGGVELYGPQRQVVSGRAHSGISLSDRRVS